VQQFGRMQCVPVNIRRTSGSGRERYKDGTHTRHVFTGVKERTNIRPFSTE
jgi:hypothetical protein